MKGGIFMKRVKSFSGAVKFREGFGIWHWQTYLACFLVAAGIVFLSGCFAHVKTVDESDTTHYDERYDYVDMRKLSERMASSILSNPPVSESTDKPVIVVYGISNRTSDHIDTKALSDGIRTLLYKSGKVRFVNKTQRENIEKEIQETQGKVSPETQIRLGAQVGAKYMLTGTLYSIEKEEMRQVRLHKKDLLYYKLTLALTNIKTALIEWTDEQEIIREAKRPFIGW